MMVRKCGLDSASYSDGLHGITEVRNEKFVRFHVGATDIAVILQWALGKNKGVVLASVAGDKA